MYCPQCGQIQQQGDVRFCSRCGLSLYEISQWLTANRLLTNPEVSGRQLSPRRRNILRAAKASFFTAVLLPIGFFLSMGSREPQWLVIPLFPFAATLVWMLYCRLFLDDSAPPAFQPQRIVAAHQYLPPRASAGDALEAHRVDTAEIVQPPSVTEYTTNLLRKARDL